MRRFGSVWHWDGAAYTDVTVAAGGGGLALAVQGGDKLYFGNEDWMSGFLYLTDSGASDLAYVIEVWDGETWVTMPQQEAHDQLKSGFETLPQAATFEGNGVVDLGRGIRQRWGLKVPTTAWPEAAVPPDALQRYWMRCRFTSGGPATLDRLLPLLYNTYATYTELASFMSLPEFDDLHPPTASDVKEILRRHEDWVDRYTRRAWRPRLVRHESHDFNPYGVGLNRRPVLFLTEVALWQGDKFDSMSIGRGADVFVDPETAMLHPNTPSFRLRYYSFLLSRYIRSPKSFRISYVYGGDIDLDETGGIATDVVLRKAAIDLTNNGDWSSYLTSGLDVVPKPARVTKWEEEATEKADTLRWPIVA